MGDLLRFFSILLIGAVSGCAGYFLGFMVFPNLSNPVARVAGAAVGVLLGMMITAWVHSRGVSRADRQV